MYSMIINKSLVLNNLFKLKRNIKLKIQRIQLKRNIEYIIFV